MWLLIRVLCYHAYRPPLYGRCVLCRVPSLCFQFPTCLYGVWEGCVEGVLVPAALLCMFSLCTSRTSSVSAVNGHLVVRTLFSICTTPDLLCSFRVAPFCRAKQILSASQILVLTHSLAFDSRAPSNGECNVCEAG